MKLCLVPVAFFSVFFFDSETEKVSLCRENMEKLIDAVEICWFSTSFRAVYEVAVLVVPALSCIANPESV